MDSKSSASPSSSVRVLSIQSNIPKLVPTGLLCWALSLKLLDDHPKEVAIDRAAAVAAAPALTASRMWPLAVLPLCILRLWDGQLHTVSG